MGLFDNLMNGSKYKTESEELKKELYNRTLKIEELNIKMERLGLLDIISREDKLKYLEQLILEKEEYISSLIEKEENLINEIKVKKSQLLSLDDELIFESFSLYRPKYNFENSEIYKNRLKDIRDLQKKMIKNKEAVKGNKDWTVNGSKTEGRKMVNDTIKMITRAFNNECESCILNVKFNNIETCEKRIRSSYDTLNKLNKTNEIFISEHYLYLKFQELYLSYEYQVKKQEEKEEQKRIRDELREQAKLTREIEEAKKKLTKEQTHYTNALCTIDKQLTQIESDEEKKLLMKKKLEIESELSSINEAIKDVDYREANQRAGYVYVISNIGAFGENIYKIGMTRRLEPMDRIDELGGASVPFKFDVHAMIFSDDAPSLENALHKAFEHRKVNMINTRREFFKVTIEEIENVIKNSFDNTVEIIKKPSAEQYYESLKIREGMMM